MPKLPALLIITVFVTGCAKPPSSIKPIAADDRAYAGLSCDQLRTERQQVAADLEAVSTRQSTRAASDAASMMVVGVPVASVVTEDLSPHVAVGKGKVIALDNALQRGGC